MTALATLLEKTEAARDRALADLRRAEAQAARAARQAQQLADYRLEYRERWSARFAQAGAIEIVRCHGEFTQRLDEAIAQQARQSDAADAAVARQRALVVALETRIASVRKLIERRAHEGRRAEARQEQRRDDEYAQMIGWRAAPSSFAALR